FGVVRKHHTANRRKGCPVTIAKGARKAVVGIETAAAQFLKHSARVLLLKIGVGGLQALVNTGFENLRRQQIESQLRQTRCALLPCIGQEAYKGTGEEIIAAIGSAKEVV